MKGITLILLIGFLFTVAILVVAFPDGTTFTQQQLDSLDMTLIDYDFLNCRDETFQCSAYVCERIFSCQDIVYNGIDYTLVRVNISLPLYKEDMYNCILDLNLSYCLESYEDSVQYEVMANIDRIRFNFIEHTSYADTFLSDTFGSVPLRGD